MKRILPLAKNTHSKATKIFSEAIPTTLKRDVNKSEYTLTKEFKSCPYKSENIEDCASIYISRGFCCSRCKLDLSWLTQY